MIGTVRPPQLGRPGRSFALATIVLALGGCAAGAGPTPGEVGATWPVAPELLQPAVPPAAETRLTCGGRTFPASALDAPDGAESAAGPEFDALRAGLATFGAQFQGSEQLTWKLAARDDRGAVFLARTNREPAWLSIDVSNEGAGWKPLGMGECQPHVVLSDEFGPATWAVDPEFPAPDSATTELRILVWERACSSGSPATGRISAPVVIYSPAAVTITIGVRPLGGMQTCPGPPGTPAILRLREPVGDRTLLDGGLVPPAAPEPA